MDADGEFPYVQTVAHSTRAGAQTYARAQAVKAEPGFAGVVSCGGEYEQRALRLFAALAHDHDYSTRYAYYNHNHAYAAAGHTHADDGSPIGGAEQPSITPPPDGGAQGGDEGEGAQDGAEGEPDAEPTAEASPEAEPTPPALADAQDFGQGELRTFECLWRGLAVGTDALGRPWSLNHAVWPIEARHPWGAEVLMEAAIAAEYRLSQTTSVSCRSQ